MFVGQTTKNVHDIWQVCLGTTLCVLAYFVKFYVSILYEIDVRGPKLVYYHIRVGNILENIPKDQPRVLEEGPIFVAKLPKAVPLTDGNQRRVGWLIPRRWGRWSRHTSGIRSFQGPISDPNDGPTGYGFVDWVMVRRWGMVRWICNFADSLLNVRLIGKFTPR